MTTQRFLLLAGLAAAIAAFFALGLDRFVSLEALKAQHGALADLRATRPVALAAGFFALYVAFTALSLPGAVILTLAAGAIFGLVGGTVLVSFASSIGATLAFLAARYLLRDAVRARFGARLAEIDRGIAKDGAFYLFTLRLVPLVPFFVINLLMGLTAMKARTFYGVSQLGMLAGTIVYVNAGTQLARIDSPQDILSSGLVISFVLLGLFPFVARWGVERMRSRRVYARWAGRKPRRFDRNMVVIGAGAAGLVTSYIAAAVKAKVTLVERHRMGGDCLNTGCVPSKALIRTATLMQQLRDSRSLGIESAGASLDFAAVMRRVHAVVAAIEPHDSVERYTALGVDVVEGDATIIDPWHVQITRRDGTVQVLSTRTIVVATGAAPVVPPLPGLDDVGCLTSESLWGLRELPRRLVVLGGGPIGCELAQAFARLGSSVTQIEMAPRLMLREDEEVSALVRTALEASGVTVLTGHTARRCARLTLPGGGERRTITVDSAGGERDIEFDVLLCAVGRAARLQGFGLETLGIPTHRVIEVDEFMRTIYPNILAAGDVAGPWQFTHTASHQAWYAAVNGLFARFRRFRLDRRVIPWCTFIDPEVARVGLNEQDARDQGVAYELTRYDLADLDRAIADGTREGFVKVLTAPGRDTILGVTIVGPHAGELIAEYVLAMKHGLGLNKILGTIHVYPTLAEANKFAAGEWRRAHQPTRLLEWLRRYHAWERG